jgi:hypothetical protein
MAGEELICVGGPKHGEKLMCAGRAFKFRTLDERGEWEHTYDRRAFHVLDEQVEMLVYGGKHKTQATREGRLEEAVKRLLSYARIHEQEHPEWNGNRFDDIQFAERVLNDD